MKVNLGLIKATPIKNFSFSTNTTYEPEIIGKGSKYKISYYDLVPDFTKQTKASAISWGENKGVENYL